MEGRARVGEPSPRLVTEVVVMMMMPCQGDDVVVGVVWCVCLCMVFGPSYERHGNI